NSFVASHLVHELLNRGIQVIALVRRSSVLSAHKRMIKALEDTRMGKPDNLDKLTVLDYALSEIDFDLNPEVLEDIFDQDTDYFHFAASMKYDYHARDEIRETNVDALRNALHLFHQYGTAHNRFFYVSTVYSCGLFDGVFQEKFYPDEEIDAFRNYYEQSKRQAENVLRAYRDRNGIRAHVIRLSQVVGNSQNGVTSTHYGIFDFARRIRELSRVYPEQTIRIKADPEANQNLISINTVVQDFIQL